MKKANLAHLSQESWSLVMMMMGRFPDLWGGGGGWYYWYVSSGINCHLPCETSSIQATGSHSSGEMNGMEILPSYYAPCTRIAFKTLTKLDQILEG